MKKLLRIYILLCLLVPVAMAQPTLTLKRVRVANWPTVEAFYEIKCIGQLNIAHTTANLTVEEDGLPVSSFSIESPDTTQHHPMSVTLVFDASGGTGGINNPAMKGAGTLFIDKMNGTSDEAALVFFNTVVTLQQAMTSAQSTLRNQLSTLDFTGTRSLLDGLHAGVLYTASSGQNSNKAVVLVSDGFDDASSHTIQEIVDLARAYTVRVYTVGLGTAFDLNTLQTLADSTGGAFYSTPDTTQLRYVYSEIFEHISDAGRESRLIFTSSCQDGAMHEFSLAVNNLCSASDDKTTSFLKPNDPSERSILDMVITNTEALAGTFISIPVTMVNNVHGVLQPMALGFTFPKAVMHLEDVEITGSSPLLNKTLSLIPVGNDYVLRSNEAVVINGPGVILALKFFVFDRADSASVEIIQTGAAVTSGCILPNLFSGRVNIGVPPRPVIEVLGPSVVCPGDSVILRLTKEYDRYEWTTGDTTRTIAVHTGGSVGVGVMDRAGRIALAAPFDVQVFAAPEPKLTVSDSISLCSGSSIPLSTAGTYTSYQWSTGESTPSVTIDTAGTYWVEVTDTHGCHGFSDTLNVVLDEPAVAIAASGPLTLCEGDTLFLRASDGFTSWRWSDGGALQDLPVTTTGRYSVRAINAAGCIAESDTLDVVVLPRPIALITSDKAFTVCPDDSLTLDAQAGHAAYLWSTGATSRRIVVKHAGQYWVKVAGPNGCYSAREAVDILGTARPVLTPGGAQVACYGETVSLDAGPGYIAYRWNSGDTTQTAAIGLSGDFWVDATEAGGCIVRSDTVVVQIRPRIEPEISIDGSMTLCEGDSVILSAPIGYRSYYWSTGETTSRIIVHTQGDYNVTVYDNEDCSGTSRDLSITLHSRPTVPVITRQDALLIAPIATAWQWYRDGLPVPTATNRSYTVTRNGKYAVEVFNEFGCGTLSQEMQVNVTSVQQLPEGYAVALFPDPSDGRVNVILELPSQNDVRMDVLDILGQTVGSYRTQGSGSIRHTFDLQKFASGVYLLRVETGSQVFTRRFIKR